MGYRTITPREKKRNATLLAGAGLLTVVVGAVVTVAKAVSGGTEKRASSSRNEGWRDWSRDAHHTHRSHRRPLSPPAPRRYSAERYTGRRHSVD